jgi:hypothetical protein
VSPDGVVYSTTIGSVDWSDRVRVTEGSAYVRAQVVDELGQVLALSNALYSF